MTEFLPVFTASLYSDEISEHPARERYIELAYPNTDAIPTTGEAPYNLEGHLCFRSPPAYPCVIVTKTIRIDSRKSIKRRVPNRILRSESDWQQYQAEFWAADGWYYDYTDDNAGNDKAREANKAIRLAAIKAVK